MLTYCLRVLLFCLLGFLYTVPASATDKPLIAAAASMKFALQEIAAAFRKDTGKNVRFSFASSGNLTRQIQQGAPFELFLSANTAYIEQLQQLQLTRGDKHIYALGRLALLSRKDSPITLDTQLSGIKHAMLNHKLTRFAIANPLHAPYGVAAQQALQHQQLWSLIKDNLVLGENVAQATQFASSGAAQAGLVSYSLALSPALQHVTRSALIPKHFHQPILHSMILLKHASASAQQFYNYLLQPTAQEILKRYGYSRP